MPRFRRLVPGAARAKSAPDDLVTEADLAMEAALTEGVRRVLPGTAVVGKEAVAADPGVRAAAGAELAVIVDPLDGTWNFTHGVAVFGVILAVARWGEPVWGLLYDPLLDDWVVARRGVLRPASLNVTVPLPVPGATFHLNRGLNLFGAIDHLAHGPGAAPLGPARVLRERFGDVWPSDHYPVAGDFVLR